MRKMLQKDPENVGSSRGEERKRGARGLLVRVGSGAQVVETLPRVYQWGTGCVTQWHMPRIPQ